MTKLKERIISQISNMSSPDMLHQVLEFVQALSQPTDAPRHNRKALLALSDSVSSEDGAEMNAIISDEFSAIEGDWS